MELGTFANELAATDLTDVVVRDTALARGFVDIKVCAIDEVWFGLKFVVGIASDSQAYRDAVSRTM